MTKIIPKFSVVIPAYKRNNVVREAMLSVLNQKNIEKSQIEVIVSDDEDDRKIRKQNQTYFRKIYPDIVYTENVYKEGPGGNRQSGFGKAKGKYIVFLDSDDKLLPNYLSEMEKILTINKYIAAVCFSNTKFDNGINLKEKIMLSFLTLIRDTSLMMGFLFNIKTVFPSSFYLCHMSHAMFRRDMIRNQKFNYDYRRGGEDWDFFVQTLNHGEIALVPKRLLVFRYSRGSSTDDPVNRENKWKSYTLLRSRLPKRFKKWPFFQLLGIYINMFGK